MDAAVEYRRHPSWNNRQHLMEELADLKTVCTSWQNALGADARGVRDVLHIFFTPPKSTPKKALSAMYGTYYIGKKDTDNLVKGVADALIGICYVDDSQIAVLHASKVYAEKPRAEIVIVER